MEEMLDSAFDRTDAALDKRLGSLLIVPKSAQPPKPEQEKSLHQAKAENIAEKAIASSIEPINSSLLSTIPRPSVKQINRDPTRYRLHYAPIFLASQLTAQQAFISHDSLSLPDYMRYAKDMEATGQG